MRSYLTATGDLILWNEVFFAADRAAFDRGAELLNGWCEEKAAFPDHSRNFKKSKIVDVKSTPLYGSPLILVNEKFPKCSFAQSQELLELLHRDKGIEALEASLECRFSYDSRHPDQRITEHRAAIPNHPNKTSNSFKDATNRVKHFLECWVHYVLMLNPSSYLNRYLSVSEFWGEYRKL